MQHMNSKQKSTRNLLAMNYAKEESRLSKRDISGMSDKIVKHKPKMNNENKVDNETVVEKIVKKVTRKISDKASAYSKYSKGSSFSPKKLSVGRFFDEESF